MLGVDHIHFLQDLLTFPLVVHAVGLVVVVLLLSCKLGQSLGVFAAVRQ